MELVARDICKSFGSIKAVDGVNIEFKSGEVKAVVGENGAGKSTLIKMLAGLYKPDGGSMLLNGQLYCPDSLNNAAKLGVAIVLQETNINPCLSIAENVFIDRLRDFTKVTGVINEKKLKSEAQKVLDDINANIDVNWNIGKLDLGQWKIIELARAISYHPKVLFLDEVSAFLSAQEVAALLNVIEELKNRGITIGFISHHMSEVFRLADTITIMKDGKWVADRKVAEITRRELEALMVGRDLGDNAYPVCNRKISPEVMLSVKNLKAERNLTGVSFDLRKGEVLGLGGLKGAGGESILSAIFGDIPFTADNITLEGQSYYPSNPHDAVKNGIALVPGERTLEGLITVLSVAFNLSLMAMPKKGFLLDGAIEKHLSQKFIKELMIKTASMNTACINLSGGNAQKVVIGKCLASGPRVLLLNNPTRGIDVGARYEIYQLINSLVTAGMSIVFLSEDLPELLGMSDRILILRRGAISKVFTREENPSEEEVVSFML